MVRPARDPGRGASLIRVAHLEECHPRRVVIDSDNYPLLQAARRAGEGETAPASAVISDVIALLRSLGEITNRRSVGRDPLRRRKVAEGNLLTVESGDHPAMQQRIEFDPDIFRFDLSSCGRSSKICDDQS